MAEECCTPAEILIFTCSGASNVGQIANQAAVDLQQDHAGLPLTDYIMVTELGFEKGVYSGIIDKEALIKVKAQVKQQISLPK